METAILQGLSNNREYGNLSIGQAVKAKREELKLYQRELAAIMGVSRTTISKWETGKGITPRYFGKIKKFLIFDPHISPCQPVWEIIPYKELLYELINEITVNMELISELLSELSRKVLYGENGKKAMTCRYEQKSF